MLCVPPISSLNSVPNTSLKVCPTSKHIPHPLQQGKLGDVVYKGRSAPAKAGFTLYKTTKIEKGPLKTWEASKNCPSSKHLPYWSSLSQYILFTDVYWVATGNYISQNLLSCVNLPLSICQWEALHWGEWRGPDSLYSVGAAAGRGVVRYRICSNFLTTHFIHADLDICSSF